MEQKGGGGLSKLSVEKFLSHITETFRRGNLLCCVSENFRKRKNLWKELGRGEYRKFPSILICLKKPKNFVGESFSLSLISGIEKIDASEGYVTIFCRMVFVSQYRNN